VQSDACRSSMQPKTIRFRSYVIVAASLCVSALICELMLIRAQGLAVQSHQERWDCWARESSKVPACTAMQRLRPVEDADFCDMAAAACKAGGLDDQVIHADDRLFLWDRLARLLRLVVLASAASSLLWFSLVHPIRRRSRPTRS
jgi:hypothetical protein